ncbi:MAG: alpha/beta hydrolase [Bacteroidota bacterium]
METKEFFFNDKKISYKIYGQGPTVVLLHGFGEDASVWDNQLEALKNYQVIIPDLPGTGRSEMIDDMTMEGMAEVVKEVRAASVPHEGRVFLLGHSMGGYITLAFAEKYSHLLSGIGLIHSSPFADDDEKKETRRKGISFITQHGGYEFLKTAIPNLYSDTTQKQKPHLIDQHLTAARNFSSATLVRYYEAMMQRPDRSNVLQQTKLPVLMIAGKFDKAVTMEASLKAFILPQLSYIHVLESSGHMGMIEEVDESNRIIKQYLQSIENLT